MKIFKTILFIFLFVNSNAQNFWDGIDTTNRIDFYDAMDERYDLLDITNYPSEILYNRCAGVSKVGQMNGFNSDTILNANSWLGMYGEMQIAHKNRFAMPKLIDLFDRIADTYTDNFATSEIPTVAIGVMAFKYHQIKPYAIDSNLLEIVNDRQFNEIGTANVFDEKFVFGASPLIDEEFSSSINFKISDQFIFTNIQDEIQSIDVDFGDGLGFQEVTIGNYYLVNYGSGGFIELKVKLNLINNEEFIVRSNLFLDNSPDRANAPNPDREQTFSVTIDGEEQEAKIGIYTNCFDPNSYKLRKPLVYVTGFNPFGTSIKKYYKKYNYNRLLDVLRNDGYDVIIVRFKDGTGRAHHNAELLYEINEYLKLITPGPENYEITYTGVSAGSFSTRLMLNEYEKDFMDGILDYHKVRTYISYEGESQGANIPLGTQHNLRSIGDFPPLNALGIVANLFVNLTHNRLLGSAAAKELLIYHYSMTGNSNFAAGQGHHFDRTILLGRLNSFSHSFTSNIGYPAFTRNIGVANGSSIGTRRDYLDGETIFFLQNTNFNPLPIPPLQILFPAIRNKVHAKASDIGINNVFNRSTGVVTLFGFVTLNIYSTSKWTSNSLKIDNSPSGSSGLSPMVNIFSSIAYTSLPPSPFFSLILNQSDDCFTPTVSTLDIKNYTGNDFVYDVRNDDLTWVNPSLETDDKGYPHIKHPNDHYDYTPYDAIYASPENEKHVDGEGLETSEFILDEISSKNLYLQNKSIGLVPVGYRADFEARERIIAGANVTYSTPSGNFEILNAAESTFYAKDQILLKPGFCAKQGSRFLAKIKGYPCAEMKLDDEYYFNEENETRQVATLIEEFSVSTKSLPITVYPNPSSGSISIITNINYTKITITDILGNVVLYNESNSKTIDISVLSVGVYILVLKDENYYHHAKFIVI